MAKRSWSRRRRWRRWRGGNRRSRRWLRLDRRLLNGVRGGLFGKRRRRRNSGRSGRRRHDDSVHRLAERSSRLSRRCRSRGLRAEVLDLGGEALTRLVRLHDPGHHDPLLLPCGLRDGREHDLVLLVCLLETMIEARVPLSQGGSGHQQGECADGHRPARELRDHGQSRAGGDVDIGERPGLRQGVQERAYFLHPPLPFRDYAQDRLPQPSPSGAVTPHKCGACRFYGFASSGTPRSSGDLQQTCHVALVKSCVFNGS